MTPKETVAKKLVAGTKMLMGDTFRKVAAVDASYVDPFDNSLFVKVTFKSRDFNTFHFVRPDATIWVLGS